MDGPSGRCFASDPSMGLAPLRKPATIPVVHWLTASWWWAHNRKTRNTRKATRDVLPQRGRKPETESAMQKGMRNLSPDWSASFPVRQPGFQERLEAGRNGLCGERFADTKASLGEHQPFETAPRNTSRPATRPPFHNGKQRPGPPQCTKAI